MTDFSSKFGLPENFTLDDLNVKSTLLDLALEHLAEMRVIGDFYKDQFGIEDFPLLVKKYKDKIGDQLQNDTRVDESIIKLLVESLSIQKTQSRLIIESIANNFGISIKEASNKFYENVDEERYNFYAEILNRNSKN